MSRPFKDEGLGRGFNMAHEGSDIVRGCLPWVLGGALVLVAICSVVAWML